MTLRRFLTGSLIFLSSILGALTIAHAAVSYDVANEPQMFLDATISNAQTLAITLAAPQWNGSNVVFTTKSGGILRLRQGFKREDILYTSASVDSSTYKVTLAGVTRNVCPGVFFTFVTCGNGQYFSKGATVELIQDARLFNLKANKDRNNLFTGSGAITFSGSGSLSFPVFATTTLRDHNLQATPGKVACSSADGVCYFYFAGSWNTFGTSTVNNATEAAAGKVQLGSLSNQSGSVTTDGATSAPTVVRTRYLTASGGLTYRKYIPLLDNKGLLSGSLLGNGTRSSTVFLRGDQTWATPSGPGDRLYGAGGSGAITISSATNLRPTIQHAFTSFTLNASTNLGVNAVNTPLIITVTGDATINGNINVSASGAAAGAGAAGAGATGTAGNTLLSGWTNGAGIGGAGATTQGGGGGGSSQVASGTAGGNGSAGTGGGGGTMVSANQLATLSNIFRASSCGSGGGGGAGTGGGTGGNGGKGGGCMIMFIGGNLTLGASSVIRADARDGTAAATNGGGGGGGGGGTIIIVVAGTITNNGVTVSAANGAGGALAGTGGNGGAGGAGKVVIYSLTDKTLISG